MLLPSQDLPKAAPQVARSSAIEISCWSCGAKLQAGLEWVGWVGASENWGGYGSVFGIGFWDLTVVRDRFLEGWT